MDKINQQIKQQKKLQRELTQKYEEEFQELENVLQDLLDKKSELIQKEREQFLKQHLEKCLVELRNQKNFEEMRKYIIQHESQMDLLESLILCYEEEVNENSKTAESRFQQMNKLSKLLPDHELLSQIRDRHFQLKVQQYEEKKAVNSMNKNKKVVNYDEINDIINKLKEKGNSETKNYKWHKVLYILLVTGLRQNELEDVQFKINDKKIQLNGLSKKTKDHERYFLNDGQTLQKYLDEYQENYSGDKQLDCTSRTFQRNLDKLVEEYKIPVENKHDMRNLFLAMIDKKFNKELTQESKQNSLVFKNENIGHKHMETTLESYDDYIAT